jgi:hypothetical protein
MKMTDYEIEKQIMLVLEKFQQSNFTNNEAKRVISKEIASKLKKYFKKDNNE